jgi:hypothetical protein
MDFVLRMDLGNLGEKPMKLSRRAILTAGLGAAQISLLSAFGLTALSPRTARAAGPGPTKLLTIFVPGGWMPVYLFCPLSSEEITAHIPPPFWDGSEPVYFSPDQNTNLDGSGDAKEGEFSRLRTPRLWDDANPASRDGGHAPHGYAWSFYKLWENCAVVHGVDMGTAAHESGIVSAMCGVAGADYRAPGIHSVVANAFYDQFEAQRPLGCVTVGDAPVPNQLDLRGEAAPTVMQSIDSLASTLSERSDTAWQGLRNRAKKAQVDYAGEPAGEIATNPMDDRALRRIRALRGKTNSKTDAFYERLHSGYQGVSKVLARDVVTLLEATPAVEFSPAPTWAIYSDVSHFGSSYGGGTTSDAGGTWDERFALTLKLLKSNLASAVSLSCPGIQGFYFDTHSNPAIQFPFVRAVFDVIGRLLGEMKSTPIGGGRTLLDDTLVMITSEFARTWPMSGTSDHWPTTSVMFVGGGVAPNRMVGGYDFSPGPGAVGYVGKTVNLLDEGGQPIARPPRSGDVIHTALRILGVQDFFIPGGSGEILGLRAG